MNTGLYAMQHIRRMRGGSQSHLLRASDGGYYVVKFQNNPQHLRVLANEMFASRLGLWLGLPMPRTEVIEVSDWLIDHTEDLRVHTGSAKIKCSSGRQLASFFGDDPTAEMADYLPENLLAKVANLGSFLGVLCFDKWAANCDGRQAVFTRKPRARKYHAMFIDQGYCFNAGEWSFPDSPLRGVYAQNGVYAGVTGWQSFEPTLTRMEGADIDDIWQCAASIPEEWYERDAESLDRLVITLYRRRAIIRELIEAFRASSRNPFPNWRTEESLQSCVLPANV